MKKRYIAPFVEFEYIETEFDFMENSKVKPIIDNAADDNPNDHGSGIGGTGGSELDPIIPEDGD